MCQCSDINTDDRGPCSHGKAKFINKAATTDILLAFQVWGWVVGTYTLYTNWEFMAECWIYRIYSRSVIQVSCQQVCLNPSFAAFFTFLVGLSMAGNSQSLVCVQWMLISILEVCSAHPTSGGPYYWSAMLAKPKSAPLASWITGPHFQISTCLNLKRWNTVRVV